MDLVRADWSPFRPASYLLPLLNDLEDWRLKIEALTTDARARDLKQYFDSVDVTFIADFPGGFSSCAFCYKIMFVNCSFFDVSIT